MVTRFAAVIASILMIATMTAGCKTGEDLVFPNQGMQQNPW